MSSSSGAVMLVSTSHGYSMLAATSRYYLLHRPLLSTNAIEDSFLNARHKLGRVTRFRAQTDQASHWLAYGLLEAEKGVQRIRATKISRP